MSRGFYDPHTISLNLGTLLSLLRLFLSEKNAQANLKSNHILYSNGNINICLANLTSHSVINSPIVLQEQTTLECCCFFFFNVQKGTI